MSTSPLVKSETAFLEFLVKNHNIKQSKLFLRDLLSNDQYKVLREISSNCLHNNIPLTREKKKILPLVAKFRKKLEKLQRGELSDSHLPQLFELLQLLIKCILNLKNPNAAKRRPAQKNPRPETRPDTSGGMGESEEEISDLE